MRVFSIIQKLQRRKSRSFQAFVSNSICSLHLNTLAKSSMPFFSPSLFLPLSHVRPHTHIHAHTARCRKLLANANSHTGIALFRLRVGGPRDEGRGGAQDSWLVHLHTRQLCFLQLFLRHTLRGTLRELGGAGACTRFGWKEGPWGRGEGARRARTAAVYF